MSAVCALPFDNAVRGGAERREGVFRRSGAEPLIRLVQNPDSVASDFPVAYRNGGKRRIHISAVRRAAVSHDGNVVRNFQVQLPQCPVNGGSPVVGVAEKRRRRLLHPEKTAQIFLHGTVRQLRSNDQPGIRVQPHGAENSRVFFRVELMTDQSGDIRVDDPDSGMPAALKITQRLAPGIAGVLRNCRPAGDPVVFRLTVEQDNGNRQAFQGKKDFLISQKGAGFPQDAGNSAPPDHFHDLVVFH